jgi:hypothetical protein
MVNNSSLSITEAKSPCVGPVTPIDVFRHASPKTTDLIENELRDEEVARSGKLVLLNIFSKVKSEYDFECFGRSQSFCVPNCRDHLPADVIEAIKRGDTLPQPILIRDTIGVDEGKMRAPGSGRASVARWSRTLLRCRYHRDIWGDPLRPNDPARGIIVRHDYLEILS